MSDSIELWQSVEKTSQQFDRGLMTESEYNDRLFTLVTEDIERRQNEAKRYHIRITNNTEGEYRYGTTEHFVDTKAEATSLWVKWSEQELTMVSSTKVDNTTIDGAILRLDGVSVVTIFAAVDRGEKS